MGDERRWRRVWLALLVGIPAVLVGLFVFTYGVKVGERQHALVASEQSDVESRILHVVVRRNPSATIRDFADFPRHLLDVSAQHRLDFRLVMALIDTESQWHPRAVGAKGEVGLMQLLPETAAKVAKAMSLSQYEPPVMGRGGYVTLGSLADPKINIALGIKYLADQRDAFGMNEMALRSFNRGPSRARERWPSDAYAEAVAFRFVALVHEVRE